MIAECSVILSEQNFLKRSAKTSTTHNPITHTHSTNALSSSAPVSVSPNTGAPIITPLTVSRAFGAPVRFVRATARVQGKVEVVGLSGGGHAYKLTRPNPSSITLKSIGHVGHDRFAIGPAPAGWKQATLPEVPQGSPMHKLGKAMKAGVGANQAARWVVVALRDEKILALKPGRPVGSNAALRR